MTATQSALAPAQSKLARARGKLEKTQSRVDAMRGELVEVEIALRDALGWLADLDDELRALAGEVVA